MGNLSEFCTCNNMECPLHPSKHDKGCAPCIKKNLNLKELPNCFFNKLDNSNNRNGDTFIDFSKIVLGKTD